MGRGRPQAIVQEFQTVDSIPVLLLTTQVGGLGLTLTAATRVIILGENLLYACRTSHVGNAQSAELA